MVRSSSYAGRVKDEVSSGRRVCNSEIGEVQPLHTPFLAAIISSARQSRWNLPHDFGSMGGRKRTGKVEENVSHFLAVFGRNSGISSIGEKGGIFQPSYVMTVEELRGDVPAVRRVSSSYPVSGVHGSRPGICPDPIITERSYSGMACCSSIVCGSIGSIMMEDFGCGAGNGCLSKDEAVAYLVTDQPSKLVYTSSKDAALDDSGGCAGQGCSKFGVNSSKLSSGVVGCSACQLPDFSSGGNQSLRAPMGYHIINKANCDAITNGLVDGVSEAFELGESVGIDISEEVKSLLIAVMEKRQVFLKSLFDNG